MTDTNTIVLAAVAAAGPNDGSGDYTQRVIDNARQISAYLSEGSVVAKAVQQMTDAKKFVGIIRSIKKENSSTRGYILIETGTDREKEGIPAGHEAVRTERTDNPDGKRMANLVKNDLINHRVLVWVEVEEMKSGNKVRVLRHVEDLGPVE